MSKIINALASKVQGPALMTIIQDAISNKLQVDPKQVTEDANLVNDLGADSLDVIEIIMEIERSLKIYIPNVETEKIHTVQDLYDVCQKCQR